MESHPKQTLTAQRTFPAGMIGAKDGGKRLMKEGLEMNADDDYFDGDMSYREYFRRQEREREVEAARAREREQYRQKQSRVIYSPSEDEDSGSMW